MAEFRRQYTSSPFGQTHWTLWEDEDPVFPPLLCLHPIPYSGSFFRTIMPLLKGRDVLAPDFPHYGGSDGPERVCSIEEFAESVTSGLRHLPAVDVIGFHTGCLVGAELAISQPNIRRLLLIDVPFFAPEQQAAITVVDHQITTSLQCLAEPWDFSVTRNTPGLKLERAFELFVEQIRAGSRQKWGFKAAFSYPCQERFARVDNPVKVIATLSGLRDATLACAEVIEGADLVVRDDIEFAVFEAHAGDIADEAMAFFDR